jgi:hypothetical protein
MGGAGAGAWSPEDLRQLRLRSHRLAAGQPGDRAGQPGDPAGTVRHLLAVQAQNLAGARWSVGLRTPGLTDAALAAALGAGTIAQTWTMRGTLHLAAPEDVPWLLDLLGPRAWGGRGKLWRDAGLTAEVFGTAAEVLLAALDGGTALPRRTVLRLLEEAGISTDGQRGSHLLRYLAETRVIIIGAPQGTSQTFARFVDRIPAVEPPDREEALRRLAVRYIAGHGPAGARDLAWWSGLTLTDSRLGLELAAPGLAALRTGEGTWYVDPSVLDAHQSGRRRPAAVHLLPGFDEYTIGYADRRLVLEDRYRSVVGPAANGLFRPAVVTAGKITGTWSQELRAGSMLLTATAFNGTSGADDSALRRSAARYADFLGRPVLLGGDQGPAG